LHRGFERVINILKEALDTIDQRTPLKDADYDQFYDAIEQFLYGNWQCADDGEIWGINNFFINKLRPMSLECGEFWMSQATEVS